mgnify:CR=1 FL=1
MDDSRFHDLIDLIYEKKQAFNSGEYLMLMNLLAKAFKITTSQKQTILNNYRHYDSDDKDSDDEDDTSYNDSYIKEYI